MPFYREQLSSEAQAAVDLVADYYRQQIAFENDRDHLVEILDWVRLSCSCLILAIELTAETRHELLQVLPLMGVEVGGLSESDLSECEAAAIVLEVAGQQCVEVEIVADGEVASLERSLQRKVLPEYEQLRQGDRIEIIPTDDEPRRYGQFLRYTDPRIGSTERLAWVDPSDGDLVREVAPERLRFAPEPEAEPYTSRYEHLRAWRESGFELHLYDTGRVDRHGKSILAFEFLDWKFRDGLPLIFRGEEFYCSPLHAIDSDATVAAVLSFLSLRPGDTDAEYFAEYMPTQLTWRDQRAEELSCVVFELEEGSG